MDSFDAVVVGAGPAGAAAAYVLAANNVSVCLLERGPFPGSKNCFGGTIYSAPTAELFPAFWEEAPLERPVVNDELWLVEQDSAVKVGFSGLRFGQPPYNKFTALRADFDQWLADKAVRAGASLRTSTVARHLIMEKPFGKRQRVTGVVLDIGEKLLANVVILAEGVNAFLTKQAGLRRRVAADAVTLYAKQVLGLPAGKIEERFHLAKGEGSIIGMVGYPTSGTIGKAAIFTNKDSLSLMVGGYLKQMAESSLSPWSLLERTKEHPLINRLLADTEILEYQAHMIPKGGYAYVPRLHMDGLLVAGDAAVMVSGRQGTDLALLTGKYAAETVVQAKARGDFSAQSLATYDRQLNETFFLKNIKADKDTLSYYHKHPDADYLFSKSSNELAYQFFTMSMDTKGEKRAAMVKQLKSIQSPWKTLEDVYQGISHWGVF